MDNILAVIPARYASSRFPGKALVEIEGQPMVWQVYQRALEAGLQQVYVATDDQRIEQAILDRGGKVLNTATHHQSGTERVGEALAILQARGHQFDFVLNIQGDEPFIQPQQIQTLIQGLKKGSICTLVKAIKEEERLNDPNTVKVVWSAISGQALYFSRHAIPYWRGSGQAIDGHQYYKHIGLYGFDADLLSRLVALPASALAIAESLEQLSWLEQGYPIQVVETELETIGIDHPDDLIRLKNWRKA